MNPQCLMCDDMISDGYLCVGCIRKLQEQRESRRLGVVKEYEAHQRADPVNPAHYKGDYVMRIIEDFKLSFCVGNVVKYVLRAENKGKAIDLAKAAWYLQREIEARK